MKVVDVSVNPSFTSFLNMKSSKIEKVKSSETDPFASSISFISQVKDTSTWKSTLKDLLSLEPKDNNKEKKRLMKGSSMVNLNAKVEDYKKVQNKASTLNKKVIGRVISVKFLRNKKNIFNTCPNTRNGEKKGFHNKNGQSTVQLDRSDKKGKLVDRFCKAKLKARKNKEQLFSFPEEIIDLDKEMLKTLSQAPN